MAAPPSSIIIPASPLDAQLLSASSAFNFVIHHPNSTTPSPSNPHPPLPNGVKVQSEPQHFITKRQFEKWQALQPKESSNLRPPAASEGVDKMTLQGYRAPQHPASHLLQSIPPRAPSRSSRSNILSYTLHLATSSRLSAYSAEHGTRTLLHWAEADQRQGGGGGNDYEDVKIDSEWFETEQKTQGLWKLGLNLLQSSRREGSLPSSVERRVVLAALAEELLVSPSGERAITKIDEDTVHPSVDVEELVALKPLTSPDTTTLYLSTSTHANDSRSPRDRSHSVAQSLIDLKFGGKPSEPAPSSPSFDDKPLDPDVTASSSAIPGSSVFGDLARGGASTSTAGDLTATPHMDYRIVLSQSMRSRAKSIFATSPLPSLTTSFCRRHRVSSCSVCTTLITEQSERASDHAQHRRRNVPGAGLGSNGGGEEGTKKSLVSLVPTFLKLSADFIADTKARFKEDREEDDEEEKEKKAREGKGKGREMVYDVHATSAWYELLTSLLTQACLEGYLVDGWTGTEGIETLFGVGCGVWEGRGWSTATRKPPALPKKREEPVAVVESAGDGDDGDEESDEEEEDEEEVKMRNREREAMELVEAAHALFGSRDVAQADYERGMRDRIHEFLNVPRDKNLIQHLRQLSAKYPLSDFEDEMVDFLESSVRALGKPALAKLDPRNSAATTNSARPATPISSDPDPFALAQYFCALTGTSPVTPNEDSSYPRPEGGKRRRLD
ncbi:uncharacterized protein JCM6883_005958 [Sporobolomyces salmoneus]|uniref:uncharacterized protein n=1 Tax=Sporobolomyces salmoneus TaxID=183962 RepID=UPI0031724198